MKRDKTVNGELSFKFLREEICENDVLSKIESGPWASYLHTCADTNASPELTTSGMNFESNLLKQKQFIVMRYYNRYESERFKLYKVETLCEGRKLLLVFRNQRLIVDSVNI